VIYRIVCWIQSSFILLRGCPFWVLFCYIYIILVRWSDNKKSGFIECFIEFFLSEISLDVFIFVLIVFFNVCIRIIFSHQLDSFFLIWIIFWVDQNLRSSFHFSLFGFSISLEKGIWMENDIGKFDWHSFNQNRAIGGDDFEFIG